MLLAHQYHVLLYGVLLLHWAWLTPVDTCATLQVLESSGAALLTTATSPSALLGNLLGSTAVLPCLVVSTRPTLASLLLHWVTVAISPGT